jgi:transcription antitermination factor NusG
MNSSTATPLHDIGEFPMNTPLITAETPQWYALHTRCRHEKRASIELNEKGLETFLPLLSQVRHWSDRRKVVEMPMFSCYVFIRVELTKAKRAAAAQVPGVLRFVGVNGVPTPIPAEQIQNIKTVLAGRHVCSPHEFLRIGQRVRVCSGSLNGVEGVLIGRTGERKLLLSIDLIQQALAVAIEGYAIVPA